VAVGDAGGCCEYTGSFAVVRYKPNGHLDGSFDGDGIVITDFDSDDDAAGAVAIQADGRIVTAGYAGYDGLTSRFALARYDPSGALDTTFSGDGKVTTRFGTGFGAVSGLAIQTDGRIVAAGRALFGESDDRFALARYLNG
jgi:uncharacterized delta-60 repeat protein